MPIVALADESTPPVDGNSQDTPCEAKEGEIYVELNEALGSTKCIKGKTGIDFIKNYISQIYVYGAGLVGLIAVFSIVIGGIQLILRGEEDNSAVKDRIFKSFIGIAILFLSALILYTLNPTFYVLE
ncbi:hypothetical protein A2307_04125 [Candidatus Peregrinibacteria bacterium RIFOXYB2_FULL_33_20]|nr:MAG: hypothetical protein A2263_04955 [Candidatus Peregrinibacteria bacterium RIFOXYA2_FULL_33_21]OGJ51623.1 MAG: hypothetical protein A2307_04125 [Candidatus Peregrinibacteria bacterium RIFOXYB2_FULL_33_20]